MKVEVLIFIAIMASDFLILVRAGKIKPKNNRRLQGEPKIVGGETAPLHAFPYQVALYSESQRHYYSGALITVRWVLTAAFVARMLPAKSYALLGVHNPADAEVSRQKIEIDNKIVHESYKNHYVCDIAILHLKTAATLNRYVGTIMIAPFNAPDFDGARIYVSGYGRTVFGGSRTKFLRYIVLNVISNPLCKSKRSSVNDGNLCLETTGNIGGCSGDAGAPIVDVKTGLLVGLLANYKCEDWNNDWNALLPDLATRVSYFSKWIHNKIN